MGRPGDQRTPGGGVLLKKSLNIGYLKEIQNVLQSLSLVKPLPMVTYCQQGFFPGLIAFAKRKITFETSKLVDIDAQNAALL